MIGGGITGLSAAHRVQELRPAAEVRLFEAKPRLGGILETIHQGDFLFERSADMFTVKDPWAIDLCRRIGFESELIGVNPAGRKAFVVRRGKNYPVPEGFTLMSPARIGPIFATPILSPLGKLRLAAEMLVPRRQETGDESLRSFVIRRFGREAFDRLIQPLIGGIYTADPAKLSMQATLPQFLQMEQEHGSLIRAMRQKSAGKSREELQQEGSGARYGQFLTPRRGMSSLLDAIAAKLKPGVVQTNVAVTALSREGSQWLVRANERTETFDAVIVAVPAYIAHTLLRPLDETLADETAAIPHAGCSVVVAGYRREQIQRPIQGAGLVVPHCEGRKIIAVSFSSDKFAGRARDDYVILRTFVGGALQADLAKLPDDDLKQLTAEELHDLVGLVGPPEFSVIARWLGVMPQYHVGHLDRVARIEARVQAIPRFALAGNAYRGVGIPFCIRSGEQAAERVTA